MINKIKNQRGFTLVEIMIVITIVLTLSSVGVIQYSKTQNRAEKNIDYINATSIATAVSLASSELDMEDGVIELGSLQTGGYIEFIPKPKSIDGDFVVTKSGDSITVKVGGESFYPTPSNIE